MVLETIQEVDIRDDGLVAFENLSEPEQKDWVKTVVKIFM